MPRDLGQGAEHFASTLRLVLPLWLAKSSFKSTSFLVNPSKPRCDKVCSSASGSDGRGGAKRGGVRVSESGGGFLLEGSPFSTLRPSVPPQESAVRPPPLFDKSLAVLASVEGLDFADPVLARAEDKKWHCFAIWLAWFLEPTASFRFVQELGRRTFLPAPHHVLRC